LTALKQAEKNIDAVNSKVSSDVQALYDRISFIYPCRWENVSIVILEEYVIKAPYEEVVLYKGGAVGSKETLDRIVKLVS